MKVLIIEDAKSSVEHIGLAVDACGYDYDVARDGQTGWRMLSNGNYDVAFVDIELPKMDGKDIIQRAHSRGLSTFLVVLSSHGSEADKLSGFAMGADEYLVKPISVDELKWRLKAISRRLTRACGKEILSWEGLVVNVDTQKVRRNGRSIELTPREKKLLILLMRRRGRPVSVDEIGSVIWGDDLNPDSTVVQSNVSRLRKKLRKGDEDDVIHTVRDMGYVFK